MINRIVLHIGDFKTGTTAIQSWLRSNVGESGIFVPDIDAHLLANTVSSPERADAVLRSLARSLRAAREEVAVISSEHFEHVNPAQLLAALQTHLPGYMDRIEVLAYVRPHADALLARYGESVKIGNFTDAPAAYLEWAPTRWRLNTHHRFSRWRAAFQQRFSLRFYDRSRFAGGSVVRDFLQDLTGRDPGPLLEASEAQNPALGCRDLALLRALHQGIGPWPDGSPEQAAQWALGRDLGRRLSEREEPAAADQRLALNKTLAARLSKLCAQDAARTDADFFSEPVLSNALSNAVEQAQDAVLSCDPEACLSPDALSAVALWGASLKDGLHRQNGAQSMRQFLGI